MFRSVRSRLVLSYMLFTLLSISMVGIMGYTLVIRYIDRQEQEYLTSNAEAIARQAVTRMWPVYRDHELDDLVKTASFLGNVRVKIYDVHRRLLADSGPPTKVDRFVWIVPPIGLRIRSGHPDPDPSTQPRFA